MASLRSWLDRWASVRYALGLSSNKALKAAAQKRRSVRLLIETLEDRLAPAIFNVTFPFDSGLGSLRQAILDANATAGADTIQFTMPGAQTINLLSALPLISDVVTIDGTTEVGFAGVPLIELNGASAGASSNGLALIPGSSGSTIRGLVINRFGFAGIFIQSNNNTVQTCYVGTNAAGTAAAANGSFGVVVASGAAGNTIGGTTAAQRNVLSGNAGHGVVLQHVGTSNNTVSGNFIGLNAAGTAAVGNNFDGVVVQLGASNNTIGGTVAGAGNVVVGNGRTGVLLFKPGTSNNLVQGNRIGLNVAGTSAIANAGNGVWILTGATNNTIGGTATGASNVISGNGAHGVLIQGVGVTGNVVEDNLIGTTAGGNASIANGYDGVVITGGATGNTIGGAFPAGNVISGNTRAGITLAQAGTTGNFVLGNGIGVNSATTGAVPNRVGVWIVGGAANNTIGATNPAAGNQISGNSVFGVALTGAGTTGNVVTGNVIGTNITGASAIPNTFDGVYIAAGASANTIGGTTAAARNVLSGNGRDGVRIEGAGATGNLVQGNYVGLNAGGNAALGNAGDGVRISAGATGNTIGGAAAGERNVISTNLGSGVMITDAGTSGNVVAGNAFGTNDIGFNLALGNNIGVQIAGGAANNLIGGTAAGAGNVIGSSTNQGVRIADAGTTANLIQGNIIGLRLNGSAKRPNNVGVEILSGVTGNTIGGTTAGARNVISGNTNTGVVLTGSSNIVQGNFIGTGLTGTETNLGNGSGVTVNSLNGNTIGGMNAAARNIISGNSNAGVQINSLGGGGNILQGNYIGVDVNGATSLANLDGVVVSSGGQNNAIGGAAAGAGNLISGNTRFGVLIAHIGGSSDTTGNVLQGNLIGTKADGATALGNGAHGVFITGQLTDLSGIHSATRNTVGGAAAGAGNVIAFNGGVGVLIGSDPASPFTTASGGGNAVLGNRIFGNALTGIDLGPQDGATANDTNDPDNGPNSLQNFPVLTFGTTQDGSTLVTGTLNSLNATFRIEFFVGTVAGNAETFLGSVNVTTTSNNASFAVILPIGTSVGKKLIATATNLSSMDTSEFSVALTVL